ncbi:DUF1998 domain-containing protein [Pelagibacteraceae bacterium]|nr:DUF1998 domain-containing protein [Pelagibacteraceae bacterium]
MRKTSYNKLAKRSIRRSQIISIFGVGSIYLFKNHFSKTGDQDSLMLAGLDAWEDSFVNRKFPDEWKIFEPRLQAILNKEFFLEPFDFRQYSYEEELKYKFLPYLRFPLWHYCHQCNCMQKISTFSSDAPRCNPKKDRNGKLLHEKYFKSCSKNNETWKKKFLIPVRFMMICDNGHIDDFPFVEWVHRKNKKNYDPEKCELRFVDGRGGNNSLMNVRVDCVRCNEGYSLAQALNNNEDINPLKKIINYKCTGNKPWLGNNQNDKGCVAIPKVVLRQASNVYYPVVKSSIFIPVKTGKVDRRIMEFINKKEIWSGIKEFSKNQSNLDAFLSLQIRKLNLDKKKVLEAIDLKLKGIDNQKNETINDEELYKYQEYNFIKNKDPQDNEDLELKIKKIPMENYGDLNKYFSNIFLIDSLVETRIQTGFTRSLPYDPSKDSNVQPLSLENLDWLPGTIVKGEGIFLELNEKKILEWSEQFKSDHLIKINDSYNKIRKSRGLEEKKLNSKFFLVHTLSHLLINQLSYSCGYGSSSLRERIYCNLDHPDKNMNGVLIYTASGDSEGSLGGLVREGEPKNIEKIIKQSLVKARVCSYDPVCLEHKSQGLNGTNASACHACSFLPETSCEESNQLLDRTTIIGDFKNNQKGYFDDLIN